MSAGLNLRPDPLRCNLEDGTGFCHSPVQLDQAWSGRAMKPVPAPRIVERIGSDPAPVNPLKPLAGHRGVEDVKLLELVAPVVAGARTGRRSAADA
jgi:hypothetical protein